MGACVSFHHKASAKNVKVPFDSTNKPDHKAVIHSTDHSKGEFSTMDGHIAVKPQLPPSQSLPAFSDYGSKEEIFFDTQAWLDSDLEDDFMSVNGEFTPSRGNTPVHHSLIQSKGNTFVEPLGPTAQPSSDSASSYINRKRLLDFFKESQRDNQLAEPPFNKLIG